MERTMACPENATLDDCFPPEPTEEEAEDDTDDDTDEVPEDVKPQEAAAWDRGASRRMGW